MRWNVVELAENGRYAKLHRGFLVVMQGDTELGRVIIDEMNCLLLTATQATLSKPVMVRLAEHGIPIVICGNNYHPIALTLPYSAHHQSNKVLKAQINASKPLNKRLWQAIVRQKIHHQHWALSQLNRNAHGTLKLLVRLKNKTKSGDPENCEAQAAKAYWKVWQSTPFKRQTQGKDPTNSALNYGYTIMRAACARAIVSAGLHPSLGMQHSNQNNPFCLVDDVMEIYRPLVDLQVAQMKLNDSLTPKNKQQLAKLLQVSLSMNQQTTTVSTSMQNLAFSLAKCYQEQTKELDLPQWQNIMDDTKG